MENDWDLYSMVSSCFAANTTVAATTVAATLVVDNNISLPPPPPLEVPFFGSPSINFPNIDDDFDSFSLGDYRNDVFQGFRQIYREICADPQPMTTPGIEPTTGMEPTAATSIVSGHVFTNQQPVPPPLPPPPPPEQMQPPSLPHMINLMLQQQQQQNLLSSNVGIVSSLGFPGGNPPAIRTRKRKNQQKKMVKEMTQEEIAADACAWRKYGKKPIKGSPHPRNYYRCTLSKGCAARRHIEKSLTDPNIFVVSYTGEHTHPQRSYRSSITATMRARAEANTTKPLLTNLINMASKNYGFDPSAFVPTFSSSTLLMAGESSIRNNTVEMVAAMQEAGNDNILVPNGSMTEEDILMEFNEASGTSSNRKDSHSSSGGAISDFAGRLAQQPWMPASSATFDATSGV